MYSYSYYCYCSYYCSRIVAALLQHPGSAYIFWNIKLLHWFSSASSFSFNYPSVSPLSPPVFTNFASTLPPPLPHPSQPPLSPSYILLSPLHCNRLYFYKLRKNAPQTHGPTKTNLIIDEKVWAAYSCPPSHYCQPLIFID